MKELKTLNNDKQRQIETMNRMYSLIEETLTFHQKHNNLEQDTTEYIRKRINSIIDTGIIEIQRHVMKRITNEIYNPSYDNKSIEYESYNDD